MNVRAIRAIVRKDLLVVRQTKAVLLPIVIVPLVLLLVLPILAAFAPQLINLPGASDLTGLLDRMPESFAARFVGLTEAQTVVTLLLVYLFAPMYLIVPLIVASVIAADAFAGEKERRTLGGGPRGPVSSTSGVQDRASSSPRRKVRAPTTSSTTATAQNAAPKAATTAVESTTTPAACPTTSSTIGRTTTPPIW